MENPADLQSRNAWLHSKAQFTEDALQIKGFQVMQRWEEGYMAELAAVAVRNGGRVLEVGFGMGISAGYIQRAENLHSHLIIECHHEVIQFACRQYSSAVASGRMTLINGFWEEATPCLRSEGFDGILFDSIALDQEPHFFNAFPFFAEAHRLLRKGGVFTYFSDETRHLSARHIEELQKAGFVEFQQKVCRVNPPADCRYWKDGTIVIPWAVK